MSTSLRIAYFAHSLRSDWNNGNAHFLRGLLRHVGLLGHSVTVFEPAMEWSLENLLSEVLGDDSLQQFKSVYPDLNIVTYDPETEPGEDLLFDFDHVILHEWNPAPLAHALLRLRDRLGFKLVFHDTHHRASSSPQSFAELGLDRFDGVLVFGESLRQIYAERFGVTRAYTLHEAADTSVFKPLPHTSRSEDVVWIGNWGDDERSAEISRFLLLPASELPGQRVTIYGVRYPDQALVALHQAGIRYGGYLPNLAAPAAYAAARLTVHIPRQQYAQAMHGIPTIRVFEALACGIPLLSAPWNDSEQLFRADDYITVRNAGEMRRAIKYLLSDADAAQGYAQRGLETMLARHTCRHRAEQLITILEESFS